MMQRAFRSYGNRIGETRRFKAFSEAEAVRVTVFDTIEEAQAEERRLIVLHQPAANINFKYVQPTVTKPLSNIKLTREERAAQEQQWIEMGENSFKPGAVTLQQFLSATTPKRSTLWYRMKAAFEEGRYQATVNSERNNPTPKYYRVKTKVLSEK